MSRVRTLISVTCQWATLVLIVLTIGGSFLVPYYFKGQEIKNGTAMIAVGIMAVDVNFGKFV